MTQPNPVVDIGLPDWLTVPALPKQPEWMCPTAQMRQDRVMTHVDPTSLRHSSPSEVIRTQYPVVFETILDRVQSGEGDLRAAIEGDIRNINVGDFVAWVYRDEDRRARYYEAQKIGAVLIESETIGISDGTKSLEDVARSALRLQTRFKLLAIWDRKRFGEVKQIDSNVVQETKVTFNLSRPFAPVQPVIEAEFTEALPSE